MPLPVRDTPPCSPLTDIGAQRCKVMPFIKSGDLGLWSRCTMTFVGLGSLKNLGDELTSLSGGLNQVG